MTVPILTTTSTVLCPHGGQAVLFSSQALMLLGGAPALVQSDQHPIAGCAFNVSGAPSPCLTVQWITGATQVAVQGTPVLLQSSVGLCLNAAQAPQGPAIVAQVQTQAKGI